MKHKQRKAIPKGRNKRRVKANKPKRPSSDNRRPKQHGSVHSRLTRVKRSSRKPKQVRRKRIVALSAKELNAKARAFRVLGLIRRGRATLTKAARQEGIKPETVMRYVGKALYRSGPGKPWKARSNDQLTVSMTVLTSNGPLAVIVHSLRERKLLGQYDTALRKFRGGEDGAEAALKAFEGKTVAGHRLITDTELLVQLEDRRQLDFDVYTSFGDRS